MNEHPTSSNSGVSSFFRVSGMILCYTALIAFFLVTGGVFDNGKEVSRKQNLIRYAILAAVIAAALIIAYLVLR